MAPLLLEKSLVRTPHPGGERLALRTVVHRGVDRPAAAGRGAGVGEALGLAAAPEHLRTRVGAQTCTRRASSGRSALTVSRRLPRHGGMRIEYVHAAKYGNGARVAEEFALAALMEGRSA